jgi:hypothetical protein
MNEYMTVGQAAIAWGISERRVHKLCKDGRIKGITRLGRAWSIPANSPKPPDERRKYPELSLAKNTETRIFDDLLGPDATLSVQHESCSVWQLENAASLYSARPIQLTIQQGAVLE